MKTLYISGLCFNLPHNFDGSDSEALHLLSAYMDEVEHPKNAAVLAGHKELDALNHGEVRTRVWEDYLEGVKEGKRLCGDIQVNEA